MQSFKLKISQDEKGCIKKQVRLIKYNSKILAFDIDTPEVKKEFKTKEEFLKSAVNINKEIFEDLTGDNLLGSLPFKNLTVNFANALTFGIIPEKANQIRFD
jgi:hypothetical protein